MKKKNLNRIINCINIVIKDVQEIKYLDLLYDYKLEWEDIYVYSIHS